MSRRQYRYQIDGETYTQGGNTRRSSLHSLIRWLLKDGQKPQGDYMISPADAEPLTVGSITWADGSVSNFTIEAGD